MSQEYDQYITEHLENLKNGLNWMAEYLPERFLNKESFDEALRNAEIHDQSKYTQEEYPAYDAYFYGGDKTQEVLDAFDRAWLHHQHVNPHHWQHWILVNDDSEKGSEALEMPLPYVYEMIADWWSFSWRNGNLMEIFGWYDECRDYMILHENTRELVEMLLSAMYWVLDTPLRLRTDWEPSFFRFLKTPSELDFYAAGKELREDGDHLEHHGIKGQKWGIRRYQNPDGSLTEEGKKRYNKTVFVSGSSKTQTEDSGWYRKELPSGIKNELNQHVKDNNRILVGDAPGIDRQVQDYLNEKNYKNVEIYGPGKEVRYSANKSWKTHPIDDPDHEPGSKEWLAKKDKAMSDAADEGLAVILPEGSKATRKNAERLIEANKKVKLFELHRDGSDDWIRADPKEYLELIALELGEKKE